jgi:hypothetical protein
MTYWNRHGFYHDDGIEMARIESARSVTGIAQWSVCWRGVKSKPTNLTALGRRLKRLDDLRLGLPIQRRCQANHGKAGCRGAPSSC